MSGQELREALIAAEAAILDCHEWRSHNHHGALEKIRAALQSVPDGREAGYQQIFNAIAAATRIEAGHIAISVKAFRDALPKASATPPDGSQERRWCDNCKGKWPARMTCPNCRDKDVLLYGRAIPDGSQETLDEDGLPIGHIKFAGPAIDALENRKERPNGSQAEWQQTDPQGDCPICSIGILDSNHHCHSCGASD